MQEKISEILELARSEAADASLAAAATEVAFSPEIQESLLASITRTEELLQQAKEALDN